LSKLYKLLTSVCSNMGHQIRPRDCALATSKMEHCFSLLAPVEALPCSNEVRGSEA